MTEQIKPRDCDFEVDYTLEEMLTVSGFINQLDELHQAWDGGDKNKALHSEISATTHVQHWLNNMEDRLIHTHKIPLSEETRQIFQQAQTQQPPSEFRINILPGLAHSLLYDMLNNYCGCKFKKPEDKDHA